MFVCMRVSVSIISSYPTWLQSSNPTWKVCMVLGGGGSVLNGAYVGVGIDVRMSALCVCVCAYVGVGVGMRVCMRMCLSEHAFVIFLTTKLQS